MKETFSNSINLSLFILRREKVMATVWLFMLLLFTWAMAAVFETQFTFEELQAMLLVQQNPIQIALQGPVYGAENFQAGQIFAREMLLFTLIAVAIMNIFMVMRHTRSDEEKGRYEVIRSLPTGRLAFLNATFITAICVNLALALSQGVLLSIMGVTGTTTVGAFVYGAQLGAVGLVFAALAALFAQLTPSARGATGYGFIVLIMSYLLRAVGDQGNEALARISPLGLVMRAEVFVGNYWQPIFTALGIALVIGGLGFLLNARRDMDQGFIPQRQGRASASFILRSPLGLTWKLTRNTLISWVIGMLTFGAAMGGLLGDAEIFVYENEIMQMMMPQSPDFMAAELFTMLINVLLAIVCIAPVLILVFKLRSEEKSHLAENVLSGAVSRLNYLASHVIIGFLASVIMPLAATVGMWLTSNIMMDEPIGFFTMLRGMMVYAPALWVMLGLGVALIGVLPKGTLLLWGYFAYVFVAGFFGDLLGMPEWSTRLSPMGFVPRLPLDDINVWVLAGLSAVGLGFMVVGFVFYRKRDVVP